MARDNLWFVRWANRLQALCPRQDWPDPANESGKIFWEGWRVAFSRNGVSAVIADKAVDVVRELPGLHVNEYMPKILEAARKLEAGDTLDGREAARAASRHCPDCGGEGIVSRYRHADLGPDRPALVTFFCLCAMGRWVKQHHADNPALPDLGDHPGLMRAKVPWSDEPDNRHCHPAEFWNAADGSPIAGPSSIAELRAMVHALAADRRSSIEPERGAEPVMAWPFQPKDIHIAEDDLNDWF